MPIKNGEIIGSGTLQGDEIRFVCDKNHVLVGEEVIKCTDNRRWNATAPKCTGKGKLQIIWTDDLAD